MATTLDLNGNEVVNGYSTNLTPNQLAASSKSQSSAIPVVNLTPQQTPITVAQPDYNMVGYQTDAARASSYISNETQAQAELDKTTEKLRTEASGISGLYEELGGKSSFQNEQYNKKDELGNSVFSMSGQLRKLNAESQALNYDNLAKTLGEENKISGQNVTQTSLTRNIFDATRENTIKLAGLAMKAALVKADYDTAKEMADAQVTAKYDGLLAKVNAKIQNYNTIKDLDLTPAQQKLVDARSRDAEKKKIEYQAKKEQEKTLNDLIINANQQGAPKDVLAQANRAMSEGKSAIDVANVLGVYSGDYRKALLLDSQLKTEKLQQGSIAANTQKTLAEARKISVEANPNTGGSIVTNSKGQTVQVSAKGQQAAEAYALATSILNSPNLGKSVGASSLLNKVPGTKGKDFELKVDQLKNALAVPNLDKLKGAMSDKDIAFLKNIATSLDTSMTESAFRSEATKVQNVMKQAALNGGYDTDSLSQFASQDTPQATPTNKFQKSIGIENSMPFQGTAIINKTNGDGTFDYKLP